MVKIHSGVALIALLSVLAISAHGMYVPAYGKYCGKKRNGGNCIDELDYLCKEHDLCYKKYGENNCKCDSNFVKAVKAISYTSELFNFKKKCLQVYAELLKTSTCKGPKKVKVGTYTKQVCSRRTPNPFRPKKKVWKCRNIKCPNLVCQMKTLVVYHDEEETVGHN